MRIASRMGMALLLASALSATVLTQSPAQGSPAKEPDACLAGNEPIADARVEANQQLECLTELIEQKLSSSKSNGATLSRTELERLRGLAVRAQLAAARIGR